MGDVPDHESRTTWLAVLRRRCAEPMCFLPPPRPDPDTIKKEWVAGMAKDPIVFITANPIPEMWPWDAKEAGARVIGTGRSDFPNQINNSLGFPGIFRGTLDVSATTITDEMCIAAATELAKCAEDRGIPSGLYRPEDG